MSDTAWARIAGFLVPKHPKGARPRPPQRWREYLDACLYVLRAGCAWRHLPHDVTVSWSAAHKHFLRWCRDGTWARILTTVGGEVRARSGRRRRPTAAAVIPPASKRPRWPGRAASTAPKRSTASNAACSSTPPLCWSPLSSPQPT
ncbi:transposase [Mycobacterium sp. SM1]|nr:transposase [Mycobacterium sp. SM1]